MSKGCTGRPQGSPIPNCSHFSHLGQHWQPHVQYVGSALTISTVLMLTELDFVGFDSQAMICRKPYFTTSYSDHYLLWAAGGSS